jgi:hypothetical protein
MNLGPKELQNEVDFRNPESCSKRILKKNAIERKLRRKGMGSRILPHGGVQSSPSFSSIKKISQFAFGCSRFLLHSLILLWWKHWLVLLGTTLEAEGV